MTTRKETVALGQQDVSLIIRLITASTDDPATGVTSATAGFEIAYWREGAAAVVDDGGSGNDLATLDAAHNDWGMLEITDGYYRVDLPNAAFVSGSGKVLVAMSATGINCEGIVVTIDPVLKYKGLATDVTSTTTEFPAGVNVNKGDVIFVESGTGAGQTQFVTSVAGQVATHPQFGTAINDTDSVLLLIPGIEGVNINFINEKELEGTGVEGDEFRPV